MSEFTFDVFLSHNNRDRAVVRRIAEKMRANGLRVWLDEWILRPGDDIYQALEEGLLESRTMVLCISPAALGSGWVNLEKATLLFRDPRNVERRFVPLLMPGGDLPDSFRKYEYIDFRQESDEEFNALLAACSETLERTRDAAQPLHRYVTAKVVLVGDSGVGKTALAHALIGDTFANTESTHSLNIWHLALPSDHGNGVVREALLWDLAGQPGYRMIHQLHLNDVAVALVVFDARSETDPLAGVRHWERALRLAQQRQGSSAVPLRKFLVSARADRGTVSLSKERLDVLVKDFGFDGYFETSAKEGWQIKELRQAIETSIPWGSLPEVSSSVLFADIKAFLLDVKKTGRIVARAGQLYDEFARTHIDELAKEPSLRDQFDTCIAGLENRDMIRRLSFGGYVLLQPEFLDAYASAMLNAAKEEPDGLGSISEDVALAGQFYMPDEQKIQERGQEQLLLHATVEELVRHDLALRESAADGRYLVFPSQFKRDYEAAPEPKGKELAITFDGPVQSLYSTLAVRLGHSGLFETGRAEMWRNAAVFTARAGGKCGLYLHEFEEAKGRLAVFYDEDKGRLPSNETRFHFEEFVLAHITPRALDGTVELVRFFVCTNGHAVPDEYVKLLKNHGKKRFECPCGVTVSLAEPKERLRFTSKVKVMEESADRQRDFEMFVESARGETSTPSFTTWAGDERVTLALVFTDVVGSTALAAKLGDKRMNEVRRAHFAQHRKLIEKYKGREIKTIGDSFMAAFKSVDKALDYAMALQANPGHPQVQIRAGIHIGAMHVEENDVFGGAVNFAARVIGASKGAEIWLSNRAKKDMDVSGSKQHAELKWERHDDVEMKGFNGTFTLWSLSG
jgi:class 3 adenylate cyclase/GTPase SAR1 family protein